MEVFGFMRLKEELITKGGSQVYCCPEVPLEYAGWSQTHKGFVPELAWNTESPVWRLEPYREALIARCESLCRMDAVELLSVGRRIGAVGRDSRLRHAMNILHLDDKQLAVPMDEKDLPLYKNRWLEVLDHLVGIQPYTKTRDLHSKLCLLENTISSYRFDRWANSRTWSCAPNQMIVGSKTDPWEVDLCSSSLEQRVIASQQGKNYYLITINANDLNGLQEPDASMVSVKMFDSKTSLMAEIQSSLDCHTNNAAKEMRRTNRRLAEFYQGQPVASSLMALKVPHILLRLGQLTGWEMMLPVSYARPADQLYLDALVNESPADLGLPTAAFRYNRPNILKTNELPPERSMAKVYVARLHTTAGGLMRTDLPAVASRGEDKPPSVELYHPLNPFTPSA